MPAKPVIRRAEKNEPQKTAPRLILLCDHPTSVAYFRAILAALNLTNRVQLMTPPTASGEEPVEPVTLVETAYKELAWSRKTNAADPITEVWLVFDRGLHLSYDDAFRLMEKLGEPLCAAWSNPSIEYWFRLHYSSNTAVLKPDEELTGKCVTKTVENRDGTYTRTTVEHVWRGMKPATMTQHLKDVCPQYQPGEIPEDLLSHTADALSNAWKGAQKEKPGLFGTSVPRLINRLLALSPISSPAKLGFLDEPPF